MLSQTEKQLIERIVNGNLQEELEKGLVIVCKKIDGQSFYFLIPPGYGLNDPPESNHHHQHNK